MRIRFSPLLATGAQTMVPTLMLFSIYLLVVGHDVPGGGFAGGLIASSAFLLVFLTWGRRGLRRAFPFDPDTAIKVSTLLAFDLGVYLVVVGLVTTAVFKLGSDPS